MNSLPRISAVICTRNRGATAVLAVQSILASEHPNFELILIDQSTDQQTRQAVAPFSADSRFTYVSTPTQGLGKARNIALRLARAEFVAFTDDDCSVPGNWLTVLESVFVLNPRVTVAFSSVEPGPHDPTAGFVPAYTCHRSRMMRNFWDKCFSRCIGASMAVRRECILNMGGFDEMLGAGALFTSAEDADIAVRALAMGQWIYETADTFVIHYGFRTWQEGKALAQRDWLGIGACYGKPLRAGFWKILIIILYEIIVSCFLEPMKPVLKLRRPRGLGRMLAFFSGFIRGMYCPMDYIQMTYQQTAEKTVVNSL
ncbi:MAG: glycosyltransferase family 2 protein [Oscillochloris sp.]|nr:glycosyltransferase family 2 protein [Oscillochloris sp.]